MSGILCVCFFLHLSPILFFFTSVSVNVALPPCVYVTMGVCRLPVAASLISCRLY